MKFLRKILFDLMESGLHEGERRLIVKNTFYSFLIQGVSVLMVFAGNLFLTRWAGAVAYGEYVHVFNWISILSVIALGGRDDLMLSQIPKYLHDDQGRIKKIIIRTNLDIFLRSIIIMVVFLALIFLVDIKTLSDHRNNFLIAAAGVYLLSFISLNQAGLQSMHFIKLSQIPERLAKPFLLILLLVLLKWLLPEFKVPALIDIANLSSLLCCGLIIYFLIAKTNHFKKTGEDSETVNRFSKQTFYFFLISLLYLLSTKITMLILPYFMSEQHVGVFNIAYRFADLLIYPFFLMHAVLPQLFAKHHSSEHRYKQSLFSESTMLMTIISFPILLLNIIAGKFFLGWFGADFVGGYTALIYISAAQFVFSIFGPANTLLMMQGSEKYAALSLGVYVVLLLISSIILIPLMGLAGAGASLLISSLMYNSLLSAIAYRRYGVITPLLGFIRSWKR